MSKASHHRKTSLPAISTIPSGLMAVRVREVLLVASEYDSYILEEDGQLAESLDVEFYQLKLSWSPRITTVTTPQAALDLLRQRPFDLVITMARVPGPQVEQFGRSAKKIIADIPVVLLTDSPQAAARIKAMESARGVDQVFIWRGDVLVFLAIVKYIEDRANVAADTSLADVRLILVVENSVRFYSSYLPMLYSEIMKQTNRLMADGVNTRQRLLRMKTRAKVLLAETFEEGLELYEAYSRSILGIITDARFRRAGKVDPQAGLEFVRRVRRVDPEMAALVQSSDDEIAPLAAELQAAFVNKRSTRLLDQLRSFLAENLGFGDFVFRLPNGEEVERVADLDGMPGALEAVPAESIHYHGSSNHFSNWCMARTEFGLATRLRPQRVDHFDGDEDLREYLIDVFKQARREARRGVIADFSRAKTSDFAGFQRIGTGSLGGKGRGLGFMHSVLSRLWSESEFEGARVGVPPSTVIGADVFDEFLQSNDLHTVAFGDNDDDTICRAFLSASLPASVQTDLTSFLERMPCPLAVRSSSLLEDSHDQPFAGVYNTYMLANNDPDLSVRQHNLESAIKLVYASTYFRNARAYLAGTPFRLEEERMAVVLQGMVGRQHESVFYPDISGVAKSFNYYPVLDLKSEDGVAAIALGLGRTVVDGEKAVRFSPARPGLLPQFSSTDSTLENAQRRFYALDLSAPEPGIFAQNEPSSVGSSGKQNQVDVAATTESDAVRAGESNHGEPGESNQGEAGESNHGGPGESNQGKAGESNHGEAGESSNDEAGEHDESGESNHSEAGESVSSAESARESDHQGQDSPVAHVSSSHFADSVGHQRLLSLELDAAERHGTLQALGSVYSVDNDVVYPGISRPGVRLVTFSSMLQSNRYQLSEILRYLLAVASERMASPVEIEFALDLEPSDGGTPRFHVLQVRPMSRERDYLTWDELPEVPEDRILCVSDNALGSGTISGIRDIVYVRPDTFDRGQTPQIVTEIHGLNQMFAKEGTHYLLIGPGRWGSADRWLGIGVQWGDISMVRAILETKLEGVPITPSEGTHFFQNLVSFGVGYLHVYGQDDRESWIDYEWLDAQEGHAETEFLRWIRLPFDLEIAVDGRSRRGRILKPSP